MNPIKWPVVKVVDEPTRFGYTFNDEFFSMQGNNYSMPRFHEYEGRAFMIVTEYYSDIPASLTLKPILLMQQMELGEPGSIMLNAS